MKATKTKLKSAPFTGALFVLPEATAVFFFGEMLPKSIAKRYSESLSLMCASSLLMFMRLFTPVSFILTKIGQFAADHIGGDVPIPITCQRLQIGDVAVVRFYKLAHRRQGVTVVTATKNHCQKCENWDETPHYS